MPRQPFLDQLTPLTSYLPNFLSVTNSREQDSALALKRLYATVLESLIPLLPDPIIVFSIPTVVSPAPQRLELLRPIPGSSILLP